MGIFTKIINYIESKNLRYGAITREVLPVFHDRFMRTTKYFTELTEDDNRLSKVTLETQNGVPVKFRKGFYTSYEKGYGKHKGDLSFSKGGLTAGDIIKIVGAGYLENINDTYEVILVTDRFVYIKNLSSNGFIIESHEEIQKMREMGGLEQEFTK